MAKNSTLSKKKSLQVVNFKEDDNNRLGLPIKLPLRKNFQAKDILRIQSQLIRGFCRGEINDSDSKTLSYLCTNYIRNLELIEYEERIKKLEETHNE